MEKQKHAFTEEEFSQWIQGEKYPDHFKYAQSLLHRAEEAMRKGGKSDQGLAYPRTIALILAKAYKSYSSAVLLARVALTEDMGVIIRSLLNLYIVAKWIATADTEKRAERYLQWFWVEMYHLLSLFPAPEDSAEVIREEFENRRHLFEIDDGKGGRKLPKTWHDTNIATMASEVGLEQHYTVVYRPLSATEHSSALSYFGMLSESEGPENVTQINTRDHKFVPAYISYGYHYLGGVLHLWNEVFEALDKNALDGQIRKGLAFFKEHEETERQALERQS